MTTLLTGGTQGLVVLQEQPYGWEVWERTDEVWWGRRVYALADLPDGTLFVGTDVGLLRSADGGTSWDLVLDQMVRTIARDPHDPQHLLLGTQPAALLQSHDSGATWVELPSLSTPTERAGWYLPGDSPLETIPLARIAALAFDPHHPGRIFAGVEVGGVFRSDDGGTTWQACNADLPSLAIHALASHPLEPETLFAATDIGIYRTIDSGQTWEWRSPDAGAAYTRALLILPPDQQHQQPTLFAAPAEVDLWGWDSERDGARCRLFRSDDDGATWHHLGTANGLPDSFEGLISTLLADPTDPYTLWLATWDGRVYLSRDRGDTWTQTAEELGQVWCCLSRET